MAFPTIPTVAAGRVLTANIAGTGTRTFPNLSSLTKSSGDLLIAIIAAYQSSSGAGAPGGTVFSAWGASFTEFCDQMTTNSSTMAIGAAYKWSDGTETGTFTVTQAATITGHASLLLLAIPGAHASTPPEVSTIANGTAATASSNSHTTSWPDGEENLWIAVGASGETSTAGSYTGIATTNPTNYSNIAETGISGDVVGGTEAAVAFRQLASSNQASVGFSVDLSNARNSVLTIAVRPAAEVYVPRHGHVNHQNPGVFARARDWAAERSGILVPKLWTPEGATI